MLILVGGPTASGKSTFAKKLSKTFGASVVRMDDFYHTKDERDALDLGKNWDDPKTLNWDLFYETMAKVLSCGEFEMPQFEKGGATRSFCKYKANELIVVEGIWAFHERCRLKGDLNLYVDADRDTRLKRRLERGIRDEGRSPEKIRYMWENYVIPMEEIHVFPGKKKADLIVTEENFEDSVKKVLDMLGD